MNQPQQQTPPEAWTERTRLLFGDDRVSELAQCHVLIVGLGGVGGFAAELIARAGIGRMTIVDADIVQPSNINRQLVATTETIGEAKASVLAARLRAINPHIQLEVIEAFLKDENMIELLDRHRYDYVIDAIDSLSPKVHLIAKSMERGLTIISSMGAGAKSDPTQIHQADLNKSFTTLALALREDALELGDPRLVELERLALILGTEGDGLAPETIAGADLVVRIPMAHEVDSLNVAAAAAVAIWELRPQR